jgi:ABC-2 type transport system permease protein
MPTSQLKSALLLSRYSLLAMLRSPTSIVFSLLFPVIFIVVFGSIIPDKAPVIKVAIAPGSDTSANIFKAIKSVPSINLIHEPSAGAQSDDLQKGRITAVITIAADKTAKIPRYNLKLQATGASPEQLARLESLLDETITKADQHIYPQNPSIATLTISKIAGRKYRSIDFILPGQLGFSLLMACVYGSSFLLFSLRQNLVFKRLRVAPVKPTSIISGEMLSRLFFHIISFLIIVALGYFAFRFTLVNGLFTLMEMLIFSLFGLFIFMGIGFIISGVVQNENPIAPIANTVVLPQILLCGLFFPVDSYPHWLQLICDALPLTLFVDGLRKIAFEGMHMWEMPLTLAGLILWTLAILPLSIKSFKWE